MKLLLDANISYRLLKLILVDYPQSVHVNSSALHIPQQDIGIWDYAHLHHYTLVTFDDDFYNLYTLKGFPPKIILLRTGNRTTLELAQILILYKSSIQSFENDDTLGLLELY